MTEAESASLSSEIAPEDLARADLYALLARLFYAPPDEQLLIALRGAEEISAEGGESGLAENWQALRTAATEVDSERVADEYQQLFIGVGKAEITLYGSHYLMPIVAGHPLAQLRSTLAELKLARGRSVTEPEDHIAALAEVMRFLIVGDANTPPADVSVQERFFSRYLEPWYRQFCDLLAQKPGTRFYRSVAQFTRAFFDLEKESFETF
ncbi:MAG TPA: molecular chaperone TorD family protein [Burkholderiales bacterium]|nr:molecular chaperone TorD family protein [Burkholderiales bacterium]